jgi:hypothetical protein
VYAGRSLGHNFRTDDTCRLDHPTDLSGDDPRLASLEADPNGFVLMPVDDSPVRARVPLGECVAPLPAHVPSGQLLARYLDWDLVLARDAVGTPREGSGPCDIGAVQSSPPRGEGAPPEGFEAPQVPSFPDTTDAVGGPDDVRETDVRRAPALPRPARATPAGSLASYAATLDRLGRRIARLDGRARRWNELASCITHVPFDRAGDRRHRWGFLYDERDGTGVDTRPALMPRATRSGSDLRLLRLSRRSPCLSAAVDPNGTGADARMAVPTPRTARPTVSGLLRRLHRWEVRTARVERRTESFDDWASCVSWLPVTEAGDAEQDLGFLQDPGDPSLRRHVPALDIDESEWDDPDYMLLAFLGRDDPRGPRECSSEPGEAVDRTPARRGPGIARATARPDPGDRNDLRQGIAALREDLEDLREPVDEITQFDECLFTVGVKTEPGYAYRTRRGGLVHRSALSFDMTGDRLPSYDVLAFPGEEPPQIECNEDAGGVETDE